MPELLDAVLKFHNSFNQMVGDYTALVELLARHPDRNGPVGRGLRSMMESLERGTAFRDAVGFKRDRLHAERRASDVEALANPAP